MGKATGVIKVGFYLGKLAFSVVWALPYLRWRIWRAKQAFKRELEKEGLPDELVGSLVQSFNRQNKQVFGLVTGGFGTLRDFEQRTESMLESFLD